MPSKILIIDDNLGPSKLAESVLAQHFHGGDVMVALRAMDAFERFGIAQPDLILLNESLPDLDCESVCYRLLNDPATATIPLVLMGNESKTTEISQRYSNVARVIAKPVTADSLQDVFSAILPKGSGGVVNPARSLLFHDPSRSAFPGTPASFRSARL